MQSQAVTQIGAAFGPRPAGFFGLSGYLDSFLRSRRALDRSPRTIEEYRYGVRVFADFLAARYGDDDIRAVGKRDVRDFLAGYLDTHSSTTGNKVYRTLRALFNWLVKEDEIESSPFAKVEAPPVDRQPREGYSFSQVQSMIRVCQQEERTGDSGRKVAGIP